jgi:probable phosphoglycerate mutase
MAVIHLARHGQTAWHRPNRYTGRSDIDLDGTGVAQAARLADWAAGADLAALACSPLRRAVRTAEPVSAGTGLPPAVDARLRELDFGIAEGRTLDELRAEQPQAVARFVEDPAGCPFPGGEAPAEAVSRGLAALTELADRHPGGNVLVVAHGTLIRLLVCAVLGLPLRDYRRRLPSLAPAARTDLRFEPGGGGAAGLTVALLAYNVPVGSGCGA